MSSAERLEPILQAVEPALRLVQERHLRQIVSFLIDRGRHLPTHIGLPFWITRDDLIEADVLPPRALRGTEQRFLLVTDPDDRMIADRPLEEQLRIYWRVLFGAAIMKEIDQRLASGALNAAQCRERLLQFSPTAVREIRYVLESEYLVPRAAGEVDLFRSFAAVYLELTYFTAQAAEVCFPTLPDSQQVLAVLCQDLECERLYRSSRPSGAAEPEREPPPEERWSSPAGEYSEPEPVSMEVTLLLRDANDAQEKGNVVRAAIMRTQAAAASKGQDRERALLAAYEDVRSLVDRLGDTLQWDQDTREEWRQAFRPLLPLAVAGRWPRAARCLYELQRIPADYAREMYAVDLPEAIRTLGRKPIRRHLPHARQVMVLMALRKAHKHLLRTALGEREQFRLDRLLHHEIHRCEQVVRNEFTPIIRNNLTEAGMIPTSRVEEVARDKLVCELLDRVCERGYLRLGNLRDAIARNQLKLSDLRGAGEFFRSDQLLRADARLAESLDGVYRRGEFYLRWIQKFSSLFFGTPIGRLFTLYIALPFGGAFLMLMFAEELRHLGSNAVQFVSHSFHMQRVPEAPKAADPAAAPGTAIPAATPSPELQQKVLEVEFDEVTLEYLWWEVPPDDAAPPSRLFWWENEQTRELLLQSLTRGLTSSASDMTPEETEHHASMLIAWQTIVGFGAFLLLLLHVPSFRNVVFRMAQWLWRFTRALLWDIPCAIWNSNLVRNVRLSRAVRYIHRHCSTPFFMTMLVLGVSIVAGVKLWLIAWYGWIVFVVLLVAYNTRPGWEFQEHIAEAISDWWRRVRVNFIPGLIATIIDAFRALANWVERQLYAVEEWMRFRGGDSRGSYWLKAILGLIWYPIAYITRFVFYLLFEPQVNPVKHFPVVTVGHKVVWPTLPAVAEVIGWVPATILINGCPGIFGFIAWELKENWKLYSANRPRNLPRVTVGSHGESVRGLLRPGFHSGTIPKIYRNARKAIESGDRAKASSLHHELAHAEEYVHRFIERELIPLLVSSKDWCGVPVHVAEVRFGVQYAEIELTAPALSREPFILGLENIGGVIEARITSTGWADLLTPGNQNVLALALRGILDMGAATSYAGRTREESTEPASGFNALALRIPWDEWVKYWESQRRVNA